MAGKTWTFKLDDAVHIAHLEHSYWSGTRVLIIDGDIVLKASKLMDFGSEHRFKFKGHRGLLTIRTNGLTYNYDLAIDGKSVTSGRPVRPAAPMPSWGWAFITACVLIPVVSLGGAIPAGIGAGGAFICGAIARDSARDSKSRFSICLGVTLLCWVIFIVFILTVGGLLGRN